MKKLIILLHILVATTALQAQQITVSGVVRSTGEALPGAVVAVKNQPTQGAQTDVDGKYSIHVDKNATLIFQYIGFESTEIKIEDRSTINVELQESAIALEDVVITVPYGVANKATFTGSAGVVNGSLIEKVQVSSVTKALQGTVAGVQSFSQSGQPGSDATIRIRGVGSVNASSDPLYVIDGVPYDGALSSLSSSDIAYITVMKDAASATLYGSRAANGVVMITTKQGAKESTPTIEFSTKFGFSDRARKDYNQLSTNQYMELFWEAVRNQRYDSKIKSGTPEAVASEAAEYASRNLTGMLGINPYGTNNPNPVGTDGKLRSGLNPLWNDDWDDALSQNAHYTDVNLRVSGGSKSSQYYVSGGYLNDQGYVIESGFKRYNLRANLVSDLRNWLQVGVNVSGSHSIQNYPKQDDSAIENVILFARSVPGFYPVYKRDLETGSYLDGRKEFDYGPYRATSFARYNLAATLPLDKSEIKRDQASIRTYALLKPFKGFTFKTSFNIDYTSRFDHDYTNPTLGPSAEETGGSASKSNVRSTSTTINNVATYAIDIDDKHSLKILGGHEYYEYNMSNMGGTRSRMIIDGFYEPDAGSALSEFYGKSDKYKLLSFFGNAEYSLSKKYYLSASVRSDASSRFHPDNRWGTFWSVGGSWRVISEPFVEQIKGDWLSNLTLRSSYGAQGNDNINDYYAYQALYSMSSQVGNPGLFADRLPTPNLSWETNLNLNIGLDFGFFDNRLSGSVEYFSRQSKDLLFNRELVPSTGYSTIRENIGAVKNYGWEFLIEGYPIHTKDWKWRLSLNATTYKNKITSLPSKEMWSGTKKWVKGGSLYDFYMIEWAGVNPETGSPQWYKNGTDGERVITEDYSSTGSADKVKVGNSLPDVSGGFQSDLTFKSFELSALFTYNIGGKIYNGDKISLQHQGSPGKTWSTDMLNRWTPDNRNTDVPRLTTSPASSWTNQSSRFLVDRTFLRLKTVNLSYTLPSSLLRPITLKHASVFVQAENLLTFAKQQGLDPEQTFDGTTYYRYPSMRTISVGFNVKL